MEVTSKAPPGHFTILYFAAANSFTAKPSDYFPAPLPISKLFSQLEKQYVGFQKKILDSCLVTINLEYVDVPETEIDGETIIKDGDEVAIIPPVSSG